MEAPADLRYSVDHEWVRAEPGGVRIGITDFAQSALGDVVYVGLPEVGGTVERAAVLGELEATKAVSEVYAPVGGEVLEVNEELLRTPGLLNTSPYDKGWICLLRPFEDAQLDELLDVAGYRDLVAE